MRSAAPFYLKLVAPFLSEYPMSPETLEAINHLRSLKLSPKQIARQLGLRPAEVSAAIKQQAIDQAAEQGPVLPPLHSCTINELAAAMLLNRREVSPLDLSISEAGKTHVFVLRLDRGKYLLTAFLVDFWCLGIKDCFGPRKMQLNEYAFILENNRKKTGRPMIEISLEEAQSIVYGAVDYAQALGFKPHKDFERLKTHLGPRPDTLIPIAFGRQGKPFYEEGIDDDAGKVLATLRKNLSPDEFDYNLRHWGY
jgi:hypothetical protein